MNLRTDWTTKPAVAPWLLFSACMAIAASVMLLLLGSSLGGTIRSVLVLRLLGGAIGVVGGLSIVFLWLSMTWFLLKNNDHSAVTKIVWILMMIFTFWYGVLAYYFFVYRQKIDDLPG